MNECNSQLKDEAEPKNVYLPKIINKTRKARINAERRLLELDALLKHATLFYSCVTVGLTLIQLFYFDEGSNANRALTFLSVASAVIITICTTYASSQNYAVRAEQMKNCYLELQRLWFQLDNVKQDHPSGEASSHIDLIGERYIDILARTENHLETDYSKESNGFIVIFKRPLNYFVLRFLIYVFPILLGIGFYCFAI